ncbi:hypothetical protein [Mycobacterium sp. 3519A]|uniref:hypothetical protein n=1 Tax=Mycobacterium sp. 3519A TaxID=2057184 RepID=UPI000C79606F|nr:hypothetical protein [Mycobacterium sp. 3519A]
MVEVPLFKSVNEVHDIDRQVMMVASHVCIDEDLVGATMRAEERGAEKIRMRHFAYSTERSHTAAKPSQPQTLSQIGNG